MTDRGSVDREKAVGYLIAKAIGAEVCGNKERCQAFTEAARIIEKMPPSLPDGGSG
ncbi:MAG: hypothetical protein ISF22_09110 [Methanomassiliicoccus sp.]|nr:hypothetical protein [Methanomassiliicoccus sp.]